jgi:hypothetical protein
VEAVEAKIARLLESNDLPPAAAAILRGYGPAILAYLAAHFAITSTAEF